MFRRRGGFRRGFRRFTGRRGYTGRRPGGRRRSYRSAPRRLRIGFRM